MPKKRNRPRSENEVAFDDPQVAAPLSQKDRFWKLARQYLRSQSSPFGFGFPFGEQQSSDGGVTYEDDVNYYGAAPGSGQYVGDYQIDPATGQLVPGSSAAQASPYASPQMAGQLSGMAGMQGFFPAGGQPPIATGASQADLALANAGLPAPEPAVAPTASAAPAAAPTSFAGAPPDQVALAQQLFPENPGLLLAIAKQETDFGRLGLGRKGLTLGYGAFDQGPTFKWAGDENQYRAGAEWLRKRGIRTIEDLLSGKAASWATDPRWESGVASAYAGLAPQLASSSVAGQEPNAAAGGVVAQTAEPAEAEPGEDEDEDEED